MQYSGRGVLSIETLRPLKKALKNELSVSSDLFVEDTDRPAVSTSLKLYLGRRSINTLIFRHPSHREIMPLSRLYRMRICSYDVADQRLVHSFVWSDYIPYIYIPLSRP